MSLFPAYAEDAKKPEEGQNVAENQEWLENSSFKPDLAIVDKTVQETEEIVEPIPQPASDLSSSREKDNSHKRIKKKKTKKHSEDKTHDSGEADQKASSDDFALDKTATKEYLTVSTISRPAVAKYHARYYLTDSKTLRKKHRFKRYFKIRQKPERETDNEEKEETLTKENLDKAGISKRDENFTGFSQEEDLTKMTAFYNKSLTENAADIDMWIKYVEFQDTIYQFEKSYRKGSIAKAQRVLAERKIAILDKALMLNPGCEALLRVRLKVAVDAFPADELQSHLKKLLETAKDNIILWQGYIEAIQCSMSHCHSPAVLSLYGKCLSTLHQLRRSTVSEKCILEESILRMFYQCGLFLRQAGLFEQLWTLIKMYLQLSLSPANREKFNVELYVKENELLELEEVVLNSQLPHHELWLRTEKLRESCHWLPFVGEECVDPQRVVFNEDVVELIHPITTDENIFKLVATCLTLLKIPLLPCRHSTMQDLGLDYVPWSLDSIETLLPVFMNMHCVDTSNYKLLKYSNRLAMGPQYLKVLPGQDEYLNFIMSVFENCAECLKNQDQISLRVWWFRFQRLLIVLDKQGRFKMRTIIKNKIKSNIKDLLKREEYRNNEIFYIEYALIEKEFGNMKQCIKILSTALSMNKNSSVVTDNWEQCQTNQCYLYRCLVEATIEANSGLPDFKETVLKLLVKLAVQRDFEALTNGLIMEAETKFKMITSKLLETELQGVGFVDHFLPDFMTDWLICNGWFLYWLKGPLKCGTFIEDVLSKLEENWNSVTFQKEVLYEFYCAILFRYCVDYPGSGVFKILDDVLFRSIQKYPNNLFLLAILAKEQSMVKQAGVSAWKIQNLLLKTGRSMAMIFTVIINDLVKLEIEEQTIDSITGNKLELDSSFKNKMFSLYKKITKSDMCTRRCGLVWRLYLQFVHSYFDSNVCRNVYYRAVEECPWLKALYLDAAIYIPAELTQIQDLIIEKQLRLHVTPEELDILKT